jgi:phosphoribosylaminoimidazole (AIR) synthetase
VRVVFDTSVWVGAFRSRQAASGARLLLDACVVVEKRRVQVSGVHAMTGGGIMDALERAVGIGYRLGLRVSEIQVIFSHV